MKGKRMAKGRKPKLPLAKKTVQNDPALVAGNDVMNAKAEPGSSMSRLPIGRSVSERRTEENIAALPMETDIRTPRIDAIMRGTQAELERERTGYGRIESYPNALGQMIATIIKEISKESGGLANFSRSLMENPISNGQMGQSHVGMDFQENESRLHQNPEYKHQELNAALTVIKKTMELDAADPFNRPVDPVALDIPDYFDVIDTPMDFGTICNNLENGLKYMNSIDVFKDVQYIWYNCVKYNKKGDYILELMKQVKTFFMRHWKAAGLHIEQQTHIVESSISRHNKREKDYQLAPLADNVAHVHQKEVGSNQVADYQPSTINMHADAVQPGQSFSPPKSSPLQDEPNVNFLPPTDSSFSRHNNEDDDYPPTPLADNADDLQQKEGGSTSNQAAGDQPSPINMHAIQPGQSSSPLKSSPQQDEPNIESATYQRRRYARRSTCSDKLSIAAGRIKITTNELGQPVGPEAIKLTSFLGITARDGKLAPLTYSSWSKMPREKKDEMWRRVVAKFDIDPSCESWVMMSLKTKWRTFKSYLKVTRYDIHATDEERLVDRDERVLPDQWSALVSQWSSPKWQNMSARNKANRAKLKFIHTAGQKSFARILEEEKAKRPDGQEPTRAELFILTHTRKNGQPVNEETAAVISQLRECEAQKGETPIDKNKSQQEVYDQIMGHDKRGSMYLYGSTRDEAQKVVSEKNAEIVDLKERLASVEQTCSRMAAQMAEMMSMIATLQKASPIVNVPNAVADNSIPMDMAFQLDPTSTSISNHEVPVKKTRGRKKRRY